MCAFFRTPEIVDSHDSPDGGQPNFMPLSSLQRNAQMSTPHLYSTEYCPDSYYNPKIGRSYAIPKLKSTKGQYSLTHSNHSDRQMSAPDTFTPLEQSMQWKRIPSIEVKETKL